MFYATCDSEDGCISVNADIVKFATRAEAEAYLCDGFDPAEWTVTIEDGSFGDCWMKLHNAPRVGDAALAPFAYRQLSILPPAFDPAARSASRRQAVLGYTAR